MTRLLYALLLGIVGAGIVHVAVLFLIPVVTPNDLWSRLAQRAELYEVSRIDRDAGADLLHVADPLFEAVACRFDLSDGLIELSATGTIPFWSMSIYDRAGQNLFSISDRATSGGALDFLVATPGQMAELRNEMTQDLAGSVFVETDIGEGIAVIRGFVPDETWVPRVSSYLEDLTCAVR